MFTAQNARPDDHSRVPRIAHADEWEVRAHHHQERGWRIGLELFPVTWWLDAFELRDERDARIVVDLLWRALTGDSDDYGVVQWEDNALTAMRAAVRKNGSTLLSVDLDACARAWLSTCPARVIEAEPAP